jgi:hypothetical protein
MARRRPYQPAHIILNIQTKNPIELTDFVSAFTSVASQYEKFIRLHYLEMSHDANIFIREVRAGSIEADLIPWALQGVSAVVNVLEQIEIVVRFVQTYGSKLSTYLGGSKSPEATRSELKDLMGAVVAIANDPNGRATLQAVAFEDGKNKIKGLSASTQSRLSKHRRRLKISS